MRALQADRELGRVPWLFVSLLSLAISGGIVVYFVYVHDTPGKSVFEFEVVVDDLEDSPEGSSTPASGTAPALPASAERPAPPPATGGADPEEPAAKSAAPRVFGRVVDPGGQAFADVHVRWIDASESELEPYLSDGAVLGANADVDRLPAGRLRDAIARSLSTASDENGAYEIQPPSLEGVVVASAPGYASRVKPLESAAVAPGDQPAASSETSESSVPAASPVGAGSTAPRDEVEVNFELALAGSIAGQVVETLSGEPAEGMVVVAGIPDAAKPEAFSFVPDDAPRASVGASGSYHLQGLRPGEYQVVPRAGRSGYSPVASRLGKKVVLEEGLDVTDVDFRVHPGGRIFGRVTDADGEGVAGARCQVTLADAMSTTLEGGIEWAVLLKNKGSVTTDDGSFEFEGIPAGGVYRVTVRPENHAPGRSDAVRLEAKALEVEVNVQLTRGSVLAGRVISGQGAPLADTRVRVVPDLGDLVSGGFGALGSSQLSRVTDATGAFRLERLPAGRYRLRAGELRVSDVIGGADDEARTFVVDGTSDLTGVVLTIQTEPVEPVAFVTGVVVDQLGKAVKDAQVELAAALDVGRTSVKRLTTGPDGEFRFEKLSGELFNVSVSKKGYVRGTLKSVAADSHDLVVAIDRYGTVTGRVVAAGGGPPGGGGRVRPKPLVEESSLEQLQNMQQAGRLRDEAVSIEADGTFRIEVPPGEVEVLAEVPGYAPSRSALIQVAPGGEHRSVEIRLRVGARLQGRVLSPLRGPVEGAAVSVRPLKSGKKDFLKELMPQLFAREGSRGVSDERGNFEVEHLPAGTYEVSATHADFGPSPTTSVTLRDDQVWKLQPLMLIRGASIAGRVTQDDEPRRGMMIRLLGAQMRQSSSDGEGRFRFKGLKAGDYLLNVVDFSAMQTGKGGMKQRVVGVAEGEEKEVEIVFGTGVSVSGTVTGLPPAPTRMVVLRRPGGPLPEDVDPTDMRVAVEASRHQAGVGFISPEGAFQIVDVEPGKYTLEVPKMPANPADLEAFGKTDRRPYYRQEITVRDRDVTHDIEVKK